MQDACKSINECDIDKKRKISIVFDDMIANIIKNKKLKSIVTELFIRRRKINISLFLSHNHILRFQRTLD